MSAVKFSQVVQPEKAEEEDTKEKETPTERDTQTQLAQTWNSFHEVHRCLGHFNYISICAYKTVSIKQEKFLEPVPVYSSWWKTTFCIFLLGRMFTM